MPGMKGEDEMLAKVDEGAGTLFRKGYEHYMLEEYAAACRVLHQYMSEHTPNDIDYEWAEFFFGISLKKRGSSNGLSCSNCRNEVN